MKTPARNHVDSYPENRVCLNQKTFVFNADGKFLTLLRTATAPTRPLKWDLPGGGYEVGETPIEGAEREIREETGLEVSGTKPLCLVSEHNEDGNCWVTVAYRAATEGDTIQLSYEHEEYRWVTKEEFLSLDSSDKWRKIAEEHLD